MATLKKVKRTEDGLKPSGATELQDIPLPFDAKNIIRMIAASHDYREVGPPLFSHMEIMNNEWAIQFWVNGTLIEFEIEDLSFDNPDDGSPLMYDSIIDLNDPNSLEELELVLIRGPEQLGITRGCTYWGSPTDKCNHYDNVCNHSNCLGDCKCLT
mgnify:CR=1 FL=1